jgi:transposase
MRKMKISDKFYTEIAPLLPVQRGNVKISNRTMLEALLFVCENGGKWRSLPEKYGKWHPVYMRFNRWAKNGVLEKVFTAMKEARLIEGTLSMVSLDSTAVKVHPDGMGCQKKRASSDRKNTGRLDDQDSYAMPE